MRDRDELIRGQSEVKIISDINVTPFIDVMLVLLIIFMITAPLMMGGVKVNLPKTGGQPMARPQNPLIVSIDSQGRVFADKEMVPDDGRKEAFRGLALESESGEVFVRGDGSLKYSQMMGLMAELGQAGFSRVTLVTSVLSGPGGAGEAGGGQVDGGRPSGPAAAEALAPGAARPSGQGAADAPAPNASPAAPTGAASPAAPAAPAPAASPAG
jgi:biopolymer transport protein ExbD